MASELQLVISTFKGHKIRTVITSGQTFWVCKDFRTPLDIKDMKQKVKSMDKEYTCKWVVPTSGGSQRMTCFNRSGLFEVLMTCRKSTVKGTFPYAFKKWVYEILIPEGLEKLKTQVDSLTGKCEALTLKSKQQSIECMEMRQDLLKLDDEYDEFKENSKIQIEEIEESRDNANAETDALIALENRRFFNVVQGLDAFRQRHPGDDLYAAAKRIRKAHCKEYIQWIGPIRNKRKPYIIEGHVFAVEQILLSHM